MYSIRDITLDATQKAVQDKETSLMHREQTLNELVRILGQRTDALKSQEGLVEGAERMLVAAKASLEQRHLQMRSNEKEVL